MRGKRFTFIKQNDAMQCGIASLAMISTYFGKALSIGTLSHYCFTTNEGVSLLGIRNTAQAIGLDTIAGKVSISQITKLHFPCILHWNQNHFVVLYKVKKGKTFYIADPGKGLVKYSLEEFKKHWVSTQSGGEEGLAFLDLI